MFRGDYVAVDTWYNDLHQLTNLDTEVFTAHIAAVQLGSDWDMHIYCQIITHNKKRTSYPNINDRKHYILLRSSISQLVCSCILKIIILHKPVTSWSCYKLKQECQVHLGPGPDLDHIASYRPDLVQAMKAAIVATTAAESSNSKESRDSRASQVHCLWPCPVGQKWPEAQQWYSRLDRLLVPNNGTAGWIDKLYGPDPAQMFDTPELNRLTSLCSSL